VNLGLSREGFLSGKIWQIVSYGFLHGGWWHVGVNAVFILVIGSRIEYIAGRARMLVALFAGILGGGVFHLLLGDGLLVGISGACLALLLLLTTLSPESRFFPLPISGKSLGLGILLAALIFTLLNPILKLPGFAGIGELLVEQGMDSLFQLGHACHLGGGLAGWLCGRWILRPRVTLERLRRKRTRREAD
jgi:membrane associated rhomboid family serine protease